MTNTELGIFKTHTFTVAATIESMEQFIYEVNNKNIHTLKLEISLEEGTEELFGAIEELINEMFNTYIKDKEITTTITTNNKPTFRS